MKIIEQYCIGKKAGATCEDGYRVTAHFAAVVDGSTSKARLPHPAGPTPGVRAMRTVLAALPSLPERATKEEALRFFTSALAAATPHLKELPAEERPTCSAAVYSLYRQEVWLIGDCQCRFNGHTHTHPKLVDTVLAQIRGDIVRHLLKHGATEQELRHDDRGRAFILTALREQTYFQNDPNPHNPFRYPVLDGTPIDPQAVPALDARRAPFVVLASDGYPVLADTLTETEACLHRLLRRDPLCIGPHPATKCLVTGQRSFDDRTFLKIDTAFHSPSAP